MVRSEVPIVSLLKGTPADCASYAFWGLGCEPAQVELPTPTQPEDCLIYVARLAEVCDILLMPLGLAGGISLDLARQVHRQRAPFRTVLFTGSFTATEESTKPLFDYMLSSRSTELLLTLRRAALAPAPPRLSIDAVERQIGRLIAVENCFAPLRLPLPMRMTLDELIARDKRYVARMNDLARVRGQGPDSPPLSA